MNFHFVKRMKHFLWPINNQLNYREVCVCLAGSQASYVITLLMVSYYNVGVTHQWRWARVCLDRGVWGCYLVIYHIHPSMFNLELDNQYQTSYGPNIHWGGELKIKISLSNLAPSQFPLNKKHQGKYLTNSLFNLSFLLLQHWARPDSNFHQSDSSEVNIVIVLAWSNSCSRGEQRRRGDTQ